MTLKKLLEESKNGVVLFTCRYQTDRYSYHCIVPNRGLIKQLSLDNNLDPIRLLQIGNY